MRLARDDRGYIIVSQPHYADHMAKVFDLDNGKVARTPLPPGTSVSKLERVNFKEKSQHRLRLDGNKVTVQVQRKPPRAKTSDEAIQRVYMDTAAPDQSPAQSTESDALIGKNLTRFKEAWGQLSYYATATLDYTPRHMLRGQLARTSLRQTTHETLAPRPADHTLRV